MVGVCFFLTCSPILDLGHFSQVILPIGLQIMPQPSGAVQLMVGVNFFWLLPLCLRAFFTSDFANCTTNYAPTIRCCEQHLMVGVNFFFDLFSHSGLRAFFTSDFANCTTNYAPTIRCCSQHLMVGVIFFLTCSPILDLGHFSQVILPIVLQIMPQKITPTIRCCEQHLMVGVNFFFDLFSHSGLRAFFTSDFTNCTTDYAPSIRCCSQHLMVGVFFFDLFSHSGLRAFFTSDFANWTTNYASPQK